MKKQRIIIISILLSLVINGSLVIIGVLGSRKQMYGNTNVTVNSLWLQSEYDGINLKTNYIQPSAEKSTNIGLILAHGYSNDRWWMHQFGITAAANGIHVVAMDYRGHGLSEGSRQYSGDNQNSTEWQIASNQAAYDLMAAYTFLKEQGCEYMVVGGHSMGGFCATRFAMTFPAFVNATIIIGASYPYIGTDVSNSAPPNSLCIIGEEEELFPISSIEITIQQLTNNPDAQLNTIYGNFSTGTARMGRVLETDDYIGHVNEPSNPLLIQTSMNWINHSVSALGGDFTFTQIENQEIISRLSAIQTFNKLIYTGIFLSLIPIIMIIELYIPPKSAKSYQENNDQDKSQKYSSRHIIFVKLGGGITSSLLLWLISNIQIRWPPISIGPELTTIFLGYGLFGWIYSAFIQRPRRLQKILFKFDNKRLQIIIKGIILGLSIPLLFQMCFVWTKIPNFIGDWPIQPRSYGIWILFIFLIIISTYPDYIWIKDSFKADSKGKEIIYALLNNFGLIAILLSTFFILNISILSIVFLFGFLLIIISIEFIVLVLYQHHLIQEPRVYLWLTAIFVGWSIIGFLPFQT